MASRRDYAKNKRGGASASRAKPAPKKKAPVKKQKRFPTGLLAITLLLISGLGYGLYHLTKVDPSNASTPLASTKPATKAPASATQTAKASSSKNGPAPQQAPKTTDAKDTTKRFEFYELLEKSEVTTQNVDAYKSTPRDAETEHSYLLQAGSFRIKEDAERMRAQLILLGLPNVHTNTSVADDGSTWYRVRLGPFENRSRLSKAYDKLVQQNIQPLRIKQ